MHVVPTSMAPRARKEASLDEVLALVEAALKAAGQEGLTGAEIFERLPAGGCKLYQLRDALLALAVPAQDAS